MRRGEKMLEWIDGRDPMHFSNSPQSETDSQQLVWTNLKLYWLKTTMKTTMKMMMMLLLIMFDCLHEGHIYLYDSL